MSYPRLRGQSFVMGLNIETCGVLLICHDEPLSILQRNISPLSVEHVISSSANFLSDWEKEELPVTDAAFSDKLLAEELYPRFLTEQQR